MKPFRYLSAGIAYLPAYHFYQKNKEQDNLIYQNHETLIDLPRKHWEHTGSFEMEIGHMEKKDLNRIRHGISLKGRYEYTRRAGYGTFMDTALAEDSDIKSTQKVYGNLGACLDISGFNLQLDLIAGYHRDVDRNNAEKIGYWFADHAIMPGYFLGEFLHDRYMIGQAQIGIPVPFWSTRVQPGFNMLYMPENNKVLGVQDYPRKTYRSVSVELSMKIGDLLPLFLGYAYGMDARRIDIRDASLEEKKGNHEIKAFVLMAFGKN